MKVVMLIFLDAFSQEIRVALTDAREVGVTGFLLLPLRDPLTRGLACIAVPSHDFRPVLHGVSQAEGDLHKVDDGDTSESAAS
jgi:hypothetical protein